MHFTITVISDTICPWCYIGSRTLQSAIAQYKSKHDNRTDDTFTITWKPFYLNPHQSSSPKLPSIDKRSSHVKKHGEDRTQELFSRLESIGSRVGIKFRFGGKTGSSRGSHRLIDLAGRRYGAGTQQRVVDLLFNAYFEEERDISEHDVLMDCARRAGLDEIDAEMWLGSEDVGRHVDEEASRAREEGVTGVPWFGINERFEIHGAQEGLAFVRAFERLVVLEERERVRVRAKV